MYRKYILNIPTNTILELIWYSVYLYSYIMYGIFGSKAVMYLVSCLNDTDSTYY